MVWTAGVTPNPLLAELGLRSTARPRAGRRDAARGRSSRIWALGDCAAVPNEATPGEIDPATCQHALRQARRLARNLRGTPRAYRYRTRGQMATLGSRHGVALVGGMRVKGVLGWLIARGYHLLQLPFAARRARVLADWTTAALFRRDVAELSSSTAEGVSSDNAEDPTIASSPLAALVIVPVVVAMVLTLFAWPSAKLEPRDLPVGVAGPAAAVGQLEQQLGANPEGAFDVQRYANEAEARAAIEDREVYGAFVATPGARRC